MALKKKTESKKVAKVAPKAPKGPTKDDLLCATLEAICLALGRCANPKDAANVQAKVDAFKNAS